MKINKYNINKNNNKVDYNYKVKYKVMVNNKSAYKYETLYNKPFEIMNFWTNGTVKLQIDAIKHWCNICCINPYKIENLC